MVRSETRWREQRKRTRAEHRAAIRRRRCLADVREASSSVCWSQVSRGRTSPTSANARMGSSAAQAAPVASVAGARSCGSTRTSGLALIGKSLLHGEAGKAANSGNSRTVAPPRKAASEVRGGRFAFCTRAEPRTRPRNSAVALTVSVTSLSFSAQARTKVEGFARKSR